MCKDANYNLIVIQVVSYDCMIKYIYQLKSIIMFKKHKEGLKTYNDLIKIFILLLCKSVRQDKEIEIWIIITYTIQ